MGCDTSIPGHALHEEGLQRQIGVGTQVSSQERRAAVFPRINRLSTDRQSRVCSSVGLHRISFVRASEDTFKTVTPDALEGKRAARLLGEPTRRRPVLPRPALPRRPAVHRSASTRPWYVRVLDSTGVMNEVW